MQKSDIKRCHLRAQTLSKFARFNTDKYLSYKNSQGFISLCISDFHIQNVRTVYIKCTTL